MLAASVLVIHVLAAPTQLGTEGDLVPFFTSPQAALASGHAPRELLLRSRLRQEVQVRHHTPEGSVVTADQLLFDLSFSSRARSTTAVDIFTSPYLSAHSFPFGAKREVHLLEFKHPWAFVSTPEGRRGWVLTKWLEALPSDPGRWLTRRDTFARAKDSPSARIITTIRSQEWLTALSYHRGWIKVRYRDYEVFVDLKDVVGRADFATWGYNASQKKWLQLSGRDGGIIFGLKGEKHWVDDFSGWIGDPHKALVSGEIRRLQTEFRHWNLSKLPEHGLVWWSTAGVTSSPLKTSVFSLDEVIQRGVFSFALEDKPEPSGLISARGVFRSHDGKAWIKIPEFGDDNVPVAVQTGGPWFAGQMRSDDRGLSFQPWIPWSQVASLIQGALGRPPRKLRVTGIELFPDNTAILLDAGGNRLVARQRVSGWSVSRTK